MTKHQIRAQCASYDPETGKVSIHTDTPGLKNSGLTVLTSIDKIKSLANKPIISLTQTEVTIYLLWARSEEDPQKMVGQSFTF